MSLDPDGKVAALTHLFIAFDRNPQPERLAVWADLVRNVGASSVWSTVRRLCKDPSIRSLPPPGVFYSAMRGRSSRPMDEPRPTAARHRTGKPVNWGALVGGDGDSSVIHVECQWPDGCGTFDTEKWYVDRISALNQMPGGNSLVLCLAHAGEHLELVGQRKQREADWAWPLLVDITARDVVPTREQVNRLDRTGFALERCSRMAKAGTLSSRSPERDRR